LLGPALTGFGVPAPRLDGIGGDARAGVVRTREIQTAKGVPARATSLEQIGGALLIFPHTHAICVKHPEKRAPTSNGYAAPALQPRGCFGRIGRDGQSVAVGDADQRAATTIASRAAAAIERQRLPIVVRDAGAVAVQPAEASAPGRIAAITPAAIVLGGGR